MDGQPEDWPFRSLPMQHYTTEAATWSKEGWLQGLPESSKFNIDFQTLTC